ncbi:hypothetical protein B0H17DRAFT_1134581 [Mycena rosella]|uniref:Uncharacterized protein n=1 Tax=Mycena rosella TaxID=1033263 RepID=A0AAD7DFQ1_MYCRO|nr:hypothetical protein B0H17DRAFT_1134581 [Mycena rosella]
MPAATSSMKKIKIPVGISGMMSHKEVLNAQHYREQDGWTVLAPPLAAGDDLPPPYTPEAASMVPPPSAAPASTASTTLPLAFNVPINSNIVGAAPASRTTSFARDASYCGVELGGAEGITRWTHSQTRVGKIERGAFDQKGVIF